VGTSGTGLVPPPPSTERLLGASCHHLPRDQDSGCHFPGRSLSTWLARVPMLTSRAVPSHSVGDRQTALGQVPRALCTEPGEATSPSRGSAWARCHVPILLTGKPSLRSHTARPASSWPSRDVPWEHFKGLARFRLAVPTSTGTGSHVAGRACGAMTRKAVTLSFPSLKPAGPSGRTCCWEGPRSRVPRLTRQPPWSPPRVSACPPPPRACDRRTWDECQHGAGGDAGEHGPECGRDPGVRLQRERGPWMMSQAVTVPSWVWLRVLGPLKPAATSATCPSIVLRLLASQVPRRTPGRMLGSQWTPPAPSLTSFHLVPGVPSCQGTRDRSSPAGTAWLGGATY
jgi:hypothetical protein